MHGDVYGYFRDDSLNATNALLRDQGGQKPPMSQKQYGGSIGGPIARNRSFYFTNLEQRRLDQTGLTTISEANVTAINAKLQAVGYPGSPVATGIYPNPVDMTHFLAKVDHQFAPRDQFSVRYSLYDVLSRNSRGAGALNAPTASSSLDNNDQSIAFGNTLTLSDRTVNETRVQFAYSDLKAPPTDPVGPAVSIAGVASFGTLSGSPQGRVNKMYQARQQPVAPGGCACAASWASTSSTTPTRLRFRGRFAARTRSHRSRIFSPAPTTRLVSLRRSARPSSRRRTRTSGSTFRTSGRRIRR